MALDNKHTPKRFFKNRANYGLVDSTLKTAASKSFANEDYAFDPAAIELLKPVMYHMDLMNDDVDSIRSYVTGSFSVPSRIGSAASSGDIGAGAEVFELHNAQTLQAGAVCYLGASSWNYANATSAGAASYGFMGVTTSTSTSTGLVVKGIVYVSVEPGGSVGDIVYLSTASGRLTTTVPAADGNVVRVMGHKIGTNLVYFNPSTNWIELTV